MEYKEVEIKSKYKYIEFVVDMIISGIKKKTIVIEILSVSSGDRLGSIEWYSPWRQYCLLTMNHIVFNHQCLSDIMEFLTNINMIHKCSKEERLCLKE